MTRQEAMEKYLSHDGPPQKHFRFKHFSGALSYAIAYWAQPVELFPNPHANYKAFDAFIFAEHTYFFRFPTWF